MKSNNGFESYMDDYNSYRRWTMITSPVCRCGCEPHCGHSCLNCDNCTECECGSCEVGKGYN